MAIPSRTEIRRVDHAVPLGVGLLALVQLVTAAAIALAPHGFFEQRRGLRRLQRALRRRYGRLP